MFFVLLKINYYFIYAKAIFNHFLFIRRGKRRIDEKNVKRCRNKEACEIIMHFCSNAVFISMCFINCLDKDLSIEILRGELYET